MVEGGTGPVSGAVADGTISGEPGLNVVGIRRAVVERNVASAAVSWCSGEDVIDMTLSALNAGVRAR